MRIFTLLDRKAEAFQKPFVSVTDGTAMRDLQAGIRADDFTIDPHDFVLFHVGDFDPITGRLTASEPRHVVDISELVAMMSKNDPAPIRDAIAKLEIPDAPQQREVPK